MTIALILAALFLLNARAFALFGIDKARARTGQRRISEAKLLESAFYGGILGAYLGRAHFRHKTRKQSFSNQLHLILMVQGGVAGGLAWAFFGPG